MSEGLSSFTGGTVSSHGAMSSLYGCFQLKSKATASARLWPSSFSMDKGLEGDC